MSATHPISGAATAAKATPAPSAHSSLADFLLAGAARKCRATTSGRSPRPCSASRIPLRAKTQTPAKDPAGQKSRRIRKVRNSKHKGKASSDQALALSGPSRVDRCPAEYCRSADPDLPKQLSRSKLHPRQRQRRARLTCSKSRSTESAALSVDPAARNDLRCRGK